MRFLCIEKPLQYSKLLCAGRSISGQNGKKLKIPGRPLKGVPGL
ncbi:hypothetical protein MAHJHV51_54830 [Mycobacterium avium subsp. hominissuis]